MSNLCLFLHHIQKAQALTMFIQQLILEKVCSDESITSTKSVLLVMNMTFKELQESAQRKEGRSGVYS